MHKIFFEIRVTKITLGQSEHVSLKSIKEIYMSAKIVNPFQFLTNPLLKMIKNYFHSKFSTGQPNFSFKHESTLCTVIAVMIGNYGCMKAVTSKNGWAILQNSY